MSQLSPPTTTVDILRQSLLSIALGSILFTAGCDSSSSDGTDAASTESTSETVTDADFETTDWTEETHSKSVDPNHSEVFDDTQVKRFDFVVTDARWQSMLDDMTATYGEFGGSTTNIGPGQGGGGQGGGQGGTTLVESDEDPIFVPADVYYNNKQWYRVGIRFKGNSTLQGAWQSGVLKLSFKMDFDEYEDDYPQIDNQRFYGFKKFSLKNNYLDNSQLREKVATDTFRNAGLASSHAAFYELHIDHGNGPEYFGLYTLVEEVDGEVLDTQFTSDDGNLYKPEDGSANFVQGTFDTADFEKKTNEDDADLSDVAAMFDALHDESASTDPAAWRAGLEATFDVDNFLKYLAVNGIIQNWDTYGRMPHNYYLYNNPDNGLLTWIPWDNNESLQEGKQGGALDLDFSNLSVSEWPLIGNIIADDTYKARYNALLSEVMAGAFETSSTQALYDNYSALVGPYATSEISGYTFLNNSSDFATEITTLKSHASTRASAVSTYLNTQ